MRNFDAELLRLKQALKVTSDQDVAAALGMTKAAFSDRKRRDAFPEDKLRAAAQLHPEWGVDVAYVLTGETAAFRAALDVVSGSTAGALKVAGSPEKQARIRDADAMQKLAARPAGAALDALEAYLVADFRQCSSEDQAMLTKLAARFAAAPKPTSAVTAAKPAPPARKASKTKGK